MFKLFLCLIRSTVAQHKKWCQLFNFPPSVPDGYGNAAIRYIDYLVGVVQCRGFTLVVRFSKPTAVCLCTATRAVCLLCTLFDVSAGKKQPGRYTTIFENILPTATRSVDSQNNNLWYEHQVRKRTLHAAAGFGVRGPMDNGIAEMNICYVASRRQFCKAGCDFLERTSRRLVWNNMPTVAPNPGKRVAISYRATSYIYILRYTCIAL